MSACPVGHDDHPLFFELKNTRAALARCQEESHAAAVKLQHRSLDSVQIHERAIYQQRENDLLKVELAVLRAAPAQSEALSESQAHVQELTLSLRKLSFKLTMTEEAMLEKTKALLDTHASVTKASAARDAANSLLAESLAREEAGRIKVKDLALKIRKQEEELRMSDLVIGEYAELVRQLEARRGPEDQVNAEAVRAKSSALCSALSQGRFDLQHVIESFRSQYDEACEELEKTQGELEIARSQLVAQQQAEHAVTVDFALVREELDQLKIDDGTAAKMVARYMQFCQSSTNSLLASLETLKSRHAATVSTLSSQNQLLLTRIRSLKLQNEQLRNSLDDMGGEFLKEKYGRRREICLRIRQGGREQRIAEGLRRWVRQSEEAVKRLDYQEIGEQDEEIERRRNHALLALSQDARILLDTLEHGGADEETAVSLSGSRARELMVRGGVDELLEELRIETERRVMLQIGGNRRISLGVVQEQEILGPESLQCDPEGKTSGRSLSGSSLCLGDETVAASSDPEDGNIDLGLSYVDEADLPHSIVQSLPSPQHGAVTDATPGQPEACMQYRDEGGQWDADEVALNPSNGSHSTGIPLPSTMVNASSADSLPGRPMTAHVQPNAHTGSPESPSTCHSANSSPPQETLRMEAATSTSLSSLTEGASKRPMEHMSAERVELSHPLLAELAKVNKRYDKFQRGFHDCHLALEGLKVSLSSIPASHPRAKDPSLPLEFFRPAVARLDDFIEDVRVELEIRIGDEALLVKGYEALLRVPGALDSYTPNADASGAASSTSGDDHDDTPFNTDIVRQIKAFVDGTDPTVKRTREMLKAKWEDAQHDIAVLKRAIHDLESIPGDLSLPASASSSSIDVTSTQETEQIFSRAAHPVGGGWTSWIRGPSGHNTPTFAPSLTLGNDMTKSSLRTADHSHSSAEGEKSRGLGILGSLIGLTGKDAPPPRDPLSELGLRIAMPSFNAEEYGISSTPMSALFGGIVSPSYPSSVGIGPPLTPKPRTSSAVYMLGLGSLGESGKVSRTASINGNGLCGNGMTSLNNGLMEDIE